MSTVQRVLLVLALSAVVGGTGLPRAHAQAAKAKPGADRERFAALLGAPLSARDTTAAPAAGPVRAAASRNTPLARAFLFEQRLLQSQSSLVRRVERLLGQLATANPRRVPSLQQTILRDALTLARNQQTIGSTLAQLSQLAQGDPRFAPQLQQLQVRGLVLHIQVNQILGIPPDKPPATPTR